MEEGAEGGAEGGGDGVGQGGLPPTALGAGVARRFGCRLTAARSVQSPSREHMLGHLDHLDQPEIKIKKSWSTIFPPVCIFQCGNLPCSVKTIRYNTQ